MIINVNNTLDLNIMYSTKQPISLNKTLTVDSRKWYYSQKMVHTREALKYETILVTSWYILPSTMECPLLKFVFILTFTRCTNLKKCTGKTKDTMHQERILGCFPKLGICTSNFLKGRPTCAMCSILFNWNRSWQTFSVKIQRVNTGFVSHKVCDPTTQLCQCRAGSTRDGTSMNAHDSIPIKIYFQKQATGHCLLTFRLEDQIFFQVLLSRNV